MTGGDWLEVRDEALRVVDVALRAEKSLATRANPPGEDPALIARDLWDQYIGRPAAEMLLAPMLADDPDIYPADYRIEYRHPLLGPINSLVRRVINLEIKRYLDPAIRKQSRINRQFREALIELLQENRRLRRELDTLEAHDGGTEAP